MSLFIGCGFGKLDYDCAKVEVSKRRQLTLAAYILHIHPIPVLPIFDSIFPF